MDPRSGVVLIITAWGVAYITPFNFPPQNWFSRKGGKERCQFKWILLDVYGEELTFLEEECDRTHIPACVWHSHTQCHKNLCWIFNCILATLRVRWLADRLLSIKQELSLSRNIETRRAWILSSSYGSYLAVILTVAVQICHFPAEFNLSP